MTAPLAPVPLIFADAKGDVLSPDGDVLVEAVAAVGVGPSVAHIAVFNAGRSFFEGHATERALRLFRPEPGPASAFKGFGRGIDAIRLTVRVVERGRAA